MGSLGQSSQNVQQQQQTNANSSGTTSGNFTGQTNPYAPTTGLLSGIIGQLGNVNPNLTGQESSALQGLSSAGDYTSQFLPAATSLTNNLLSGGGANSFAPMAQNSYSQYQQQLSPYASGQYLDPMSTPGFGTQLSTLNSDITNQINGMFAGAGRDLSGSNAQTLARGLSQGEGGLIQNQANQNRAEQLAAAGSLYGAGNSTTGILSGLNQTALGNQQAGLGTAQAGQQIASDPYNAQLAAAAQARGIPLSTMQLLASLGVNLGGVGGTTSGQQAGTQSGATSSMGNTSVSGTNTASPIQDANGIASILGKFFGS